MEEVASWWPEYILRVYLGIFFAEFQKMCGYILYDSAISFFFVFAHIHGLLHLLGLIKSDWFFSFAHPLTLTAWHSPDDNEFIGIEYK